MYPKLKTCLAHFGGAEWDEIGIASNWVEEITNLSDPKIVQGHFCTVGVAMQVNLIINQNSRRYGH
jgi:hypothetical protein